MEAARNRLSSATWSDSMSRAEVRCGGLRGQLSKADPAAGLGDLSLDTLELLGNLFRIICGSDQLVAPSECYVRGDDHVSTHPSSEEFPFRTQLYWSAQELVGGDVAVTLTVSLQTDLLDTRPELTFVTRFEQASAQAQDGRCQFDLTSGGRVVITPHPSDELEFRTAASGNEVTMDFAPPFLEKGVIRRCRVAAIFFASPADDARVEQAITEFAAMPLPLTT